MSQRAVKRVQEELGEKVLETSDFRGDDEVRVAPESWLEVARFLHDDADLQMNHFIDLTAVDYPERELDEDEPRFDVLLMVRSMPSGDRLRLKTRVAEDQELDSLVSVWGGANWAEREVYDMFGIRFKNHPDMRRILMYPEFEGYPLRKDYPIDRTQPLVPYRRSEGINKLEPFGRTEGQPWNRIDWLARMGHRNVQVSPAIAVQQGEREGISISNERQAGLPEDEESSAEREGEA